jgi:hypothetical protein
VPGAAKSRGAIQPVVESGSICGAMTSITSRTLMRMGPELLEADAESLPDVLSELLPQSSGS